MNKEEIIEFIVQEYDLNKERTTTAVDAFMENGIGINDGSVEVSDVADYIVTKSEYWEPI